MMRLVKRTIVRALDRAGYTLVRKPAPAVAIGGTHNRTPSVRLTDKSLSRAVSYIIGAKIAGDVVDCGIGEPEDLAAIALALKAQGDLSRRLILFDTSMNPAHRGEKVMPLWGSWGDALFREENKGLRSPPTLQQAIPSALAKTDYPASNIRSVTQITERAVQSNIDRPIALLLVTCHTHKANALVISRLLPSLADQALIVVRGYSPKAADAGAIVALLRSQLAGLALSHMTGSYWMGTVSRLLSNPIHRFEGVLKAINSAIDNRDTPNARLAQGLAGDLLRRLTALEGTALTADLPAVQEDSAVKTLGRKEVAASSIPREGAAVLLVCGQSNASNEGERPYLPKHKIYNWNITDNRFYLAKDPLLGTTGEGGGFSTRLADLLVDSGKFAQVVIANVAIGGSFVHDWTPSGRYHGRLLAAVERLKEYGLPVTHMLWHQGEADAVVETDAASYQDRFMSIAQSLWQHGLMSPIYVATATLRNHSQINTAVREAQQSLVNNRTIFAGPDSDTLGANMRMADGCHLSESGVAAHAQLWLEALSK